MGYRDALSAALSKHPRLSPLLDELGLEVGDEWFEKIFRWLTTEAHGAVPSPREGRAQVPFRADAS